MVIRAVLPFIVMAIFSDPSYECNDDGFTAGSSSAKMPDVVVFSDPRQKRSDINQSSRAQKKAFMASLIKVEQLVHILMQVCQSSKVTNVTSVSIADVPHQDEDEKHNDDEDV